MELDWAALEHFFCELMVVISGILCVGGVGQVSKKNLKLRVKVNSILKLGYQSDNNSDSSCML